MIHHRLLSRALAIVATSAGALLLAAACGGGGDGGTTPAATSTPGSATAPATATSGGGAAPAADKIEVLAKDNVFEPKDIEVPVGKEVEIELKNTGQAIHNMRVLSQAAEGKDYASDAMVKPGKDSDFKVKFSKKGTYNFQCDFHMPDMVGTITAK